MGFSPKRSNKNVLYNNTCSLISINYQMYNKTYFNNSSVLENQKQIFSTLYAMGFVRVRIYVPQSEIFVGLMLIIIVLLIAV